MAATIPMDTLQFLGTAIKLSYESAYLYGYEHFWNGNELNDLGFKDRCGKKFYKNSLHGY